MVQLRGKRSTLIRNQQIDKDGRKINIPSRPGQSVNIVSIYKHVGSPICISGSWVPAAEHNARAAMSAYVPIAHNIFMSARISIQHKITFAKSLIFSRLFYNVQIW